MRRTTHKGQRPESKAAVTLCVVAAISIAVRVQAQCQYEITVIQAGPDCGVLPPSVTRGRAINESAQIAGGYIVCVIGGGEAFLWEGGPEVITLRRPPGVGGAGAWDISDQGLIVGTMVGTGVGDRAFLDDGTGMLDLGTLPGGNFSRGRAINSANQVVGLWGNSLSGNPSLAAFLWQDGVMIDLNAELGTPNSEALDINDQGQATGWMGMSLVNGGQAFIWEKGRLTPLGGFPDGSFSEGESINEFGQVAGWARIGPFPGTDIRAFLWSEGETIDLGLLPGYAQTNASGINDLGQIVGGAAGVDGNINIQAAFIWQNGVMTNLNDLIPQDSGLLLRVGKAINNAGQIIAWAQGTATVFLDPIDQPPGDVDNDCAVGKADLDILIAAWGPCPGGGSCPADVDGNGDVDVLDLLTLLGNWTF